MLKNVTNDVSNDRSHLISELFETITQILTKVCNFAVLFVAISYSLNDTFSLPAMIWCSYFDFQDNVFALAS